MALMWRPGRASRGVLVLIAAISIIGYVLVEQLPSKQRKKYYREKMAAAKLMDAGMKAIRDKKLLIFGRIDTEHDPNGTGMIGSGLTPITSKEGSLAAKQTSANPNFAAVLVQLYKRASLKKGDVVAMGFSGSFPSLNLASMVAAEVLGLEPIAISSASASRWGANNPQFSWLDMERLLYEKGIIHHRSVAASLGGERDRGGGIPPEGIRHLRKIIKRNGVELIDPASLEASWDLRMNIYREEAGKRPISCFVNTGGGAGSVGSPLVKKMFKSGLNRTTPVPDRIRDSVMTRISRAGIPVIHLINIVRMAKRYGLPVQPDHYPEVAEGGIFTDLEYDTTLAWVVLLALILATFILLRMDVAHYFLRIKSNMQRTGRPKNS
ncbi:MAG TPA: poly-gamma-glutamate system protein [Myxococcota bacterium]|nr:poly-gamma-glutamate system protein [Myxococcota bacterium]